MKTQTRFDPTKHPRDVPSGRFAEMRRADAGHDLLDNEQERFDWIPDEVLMPETARIAAYAVRNKLSASRCVDVTIEDVQAEVLLALMSRRRRQVASVAVSDAEPVQLPEGSSERAYAFTVAAASVTNLAFRPQNVYDPKANRLLTEARGAEEQKLGRALTGAETEDLAERIRLSFPPKRRPSSGFHHSKQTISIDELSELAPRATVADDPETAALGVGTDFAEGSAGDQAWSLLEAGERKFQASRLAYVALAQQRDWPEPAEHSLSEESSTRARKTITSAGGVRLVAEQVRAGTVSQRALEAFTAAFPGADIAQAEQLADALMEHPSYAEELWSSTLQFATIRHRRTRLGDNTAVA